MRGCSEYYTAYQQESAPNDTPSSSDPVGADSEKEHPKYVTDQQGVGQASLHLGGHLSRIELGEYGVGIC
jgi:hypothetical protein